MAEETELPKPKILMRFGADVKSPTVEIAQGEYRRKFDASDQPFTVENAEEARMLRETGHFLDESEPRAVATGSTSAPNGEETVDAQAAKPSRSARTKIVGESAGEAKGE